MVQREEGRVGAGALTAFQLILVVYYLLGLLSIQYITVDKWFHRFVIGIVFKRV